VVLILSVVLHPSNILQTVAAIAISPSEEWIFYDAFEVDNYVPLCQLSWACVAGSACLSSASPQVDPCVCLQLYKLWNTPRKDVLYISSTMTPDIFRCCARLAPPVLVAPLLRHVPLVHPVSTATWVQGSVANVLLATRVLAARLPKQP
jgi:hypothetical protein